MTYGYRKSINLPFDEAVDRTVDILTKAGFGIMTNINVQAVLKEKLNVDMKQYKILGACSSSHAYQSLQLEEEIGLLLPCNIIVYETNKGVTVSAIDPEKAMSIIDNDTVKPIAIEVGVMLKNVIDAI